MTASALSKAVRDYYGLLDDTDAGWALLTDRYQRTTSRSRDYYDRFWGAISRVQVSDVTSEAPSSVVATLRYDYDDGRSFIERTSYSLVREDGRLKIDRCVGPQQPSGLITPTAQRAAPVSPPRAPAGCWGARGEPESRRHRSRAGRP